MLSATLSCGVELQDVLTAFSNRDWDKIERYATHEAGGGKPTQDHYEAAIERWVNENDAQQRAGKQIAPKDGAPTFDNVEDLHDWAKKAWSKDDPKAPEKIEAHRMYYGLGEHAGAEYVGNRAAIARRMDVSDDTIKNWLEGQTETKTTKSTQGISQRLKEHELTHLFDAHDSRDDRRAKEDLRLEPDAVHEDGEHVKTDDELREENAAEAGDTPEHESTQTHDIEGDDEQNYHQVGEAAADTNLNIQDGHYGKADTGIALDQRGREVQRKVQAQIKDEPALRATWEKHMALLKKSDRVSWDDLSKEKGGVQQGAGVKLAFQNSGADASSARNLASAWKDGIRFSDNPPTGWGAVGGGGHNAPPQAGAIPALKTGADIRGSDHARIAQEYPALRAPSTAPVTGFLTRPPNASETAHIAAAVHNLESAPELNGLTQALKKLNTVGVFMPKPTQTKYSGFFHPRTGQVMLSSALVNGSHADPVVAARVMSTLAHELVHVYQHDGARDVSARPDSPTYTQLVRNTAGAVDAIHANPVAEEALNAYFDDPSKHSGLRYVMQPLQDVVATGKAGEVEADAVYHLATELGPRLVQLYIRDPDWLKRELPVGYAHVKELLGKSNDTKPPREGEGPIDRQSGALRFDEGVSGEVRQDADAGGERVRQGLPGEAGRVAQDQPHPPGAADPEQGAGRGSGGLTPPKGPTSVDNWDPNKGGFLRNVKDLLQNKWRSMPQLLGFATTEQLAERFREHPAVRAFHEAISRMEARANGLMERSDATMATWRALDKKNGDAKASKFAQFLKDSTLSGIWASESLDHPVNEHLDPTSTATATEHARLANEWKSLGDDYRRLFTRMQNEFADTHKAMFEATRNRVKEGFYDSAPKDWVDRAATAKSAAERKAFLSGATDDQKATAKDLWSDLDEHHSDFANRVPGPYFPQSRFGDHVVSYKSAEHRQLEAELDSAKQKLSDHAVSPEAEAIKKQAAKVADMQAGIRRFDPGTQAALKATLLGEKVKLEKMQEGPTKLREDVKAAHAALTASKRNGDNYHAEFFERHGDAVARKAQLEKLLGPTYEVKHQLKDTYDRATDGAAPAYMRRIEKALTAGASTAEASQIRESLREMRIRALPERSILKNQLKRVGTSGARLDEAHRAFAAHGVASSWTLSRMEHQQDMTNAVAELRHGSDMDGKILGNELALRVKQNMDKPRNGQLIGAATNLTHMSYLGLSPAFLTTVASHPFFIATPVIAARHGMAALTARAEAFRNAGSIINLARKDKGSALHLRVSPEEMVGKGITANESKMLRTMIDNNRINTTQMADLYAASSGREKNYLDHAADFASTPAHLLEQTNRISTALVAYRLELAKQQKAGMAADAAHDAATAYADKIIGETHLNYSSSNRARFLHPNSWGGWGRVIFQFRSFQQGMLYLVGKNLVDATRGDKEAAKAAAYLIGTQMATAGLTGLPGAAAAFAAANGVYNLFNDADDQKDLKQTLHNALSEINPALADAIVKGVPAAAGLDISERTGLGNIASPLPHADSTKEGKDAVAANWLALTGGPFGGMAANYAEAYKAARLGDYHRATTLALPNSVASVIKAVEMAKHGITDTRGDTLVDPSQLTAANILAQAAGLRSTTQSNLQEKRASYYDEKNARDEVRKSLLTQYVRAQTRGEDMDNLQERIAGFNERHPDDRISQGELVRARVSEQRAQNQMRAGIPVGKRDRDFAAERGME